MEDNDGFCGGFPISGESFSFLISLPLSGAILIFYKIYVE